MESHCSPEKGISVERLFNFSLAFVLLLGLFPLMLIIALLIVVMDRRPVLYRGKRLGLGGRVFTMYKFRTLSNNAEQSIGARLMRDDENFITPMGKLLRWSKLDELPQLFNILRGEMNFVGPRPVRPLLAEKYSMSIENYNMRFEVRPGLTGIAQVRGGYYCDPRRKTRYDVFYIRKRGIILDLKVMGLTALNMLWSPHCLKLGKMQIARALEKKRENQEQAETEIAA